jgi:pimeloyl-ACP methyl ester carboxylesterase
MIPRWVDREQFPFVVHTFDTSDGRMAYVDEGRGEALVFVHGNPSWSFLYRHLIEPLSKSYRCIAVDHLGFGLSDKPARADYSPQAHAARLEEFLDYLQVDRVTLVAHDFGGPIAFAWGLRHPDRVRSLVFFNTWLWSLKGQPDAMQLFKNFDSAWNRFYYTQLKASPKFFLPVLVADAHQMPKHVLEQYLLPFSEHKTRQGAYSLARHLIRSSSWFDDLWENRERLIHVPMLLLWGNNDQFSGPDGLERLEAGFPLSRSVQLPEAGNFVPQDAVRRTLVEMRGFLRSTMTDLPEPKL